MSMNKGFGNSIGWSGGSGPINTCSLKIGNSKGGYGSSGKPAPQYGASPPMPIMPIPTGCEKPRTGSKSK